MTAVSWEREHIEIELSKKAKVSGELDRICVAFHDLVLEHKAPSAIFCQRRHKPTQSQREGAWTPYLNENSLKEFAAMFYKHHAS